MYLRRAVGKTLTLPLRTPPSSPPLLWKHASLRQMSSKRVPGLAGSNMIYYLFVGVTFSAGGYYAYRTFTSDQSRYTERINNMQVKSTMRESPEMLQHPDEEVKPTETNEGCSEAPNDASPLEAGLETAEEIPDVEDAALEETSAVSVEAGSEETPAVRVGAGSETQAVGVEAGSEETPAVSVGASPEIGDGAVVSVESGPEVTDAAVLEEAEAGDKAPKPEEASAVDTELEEEKKSPPQVETSAEAESQEEAPPQA
ncbi:protein MGARP [Trichosurus vulpecula]|uniref:protein MGARP n=1 Tax=Trichosurus vulpecula TaxID=9337 RepID=UPI00186B421C|nr:protein MGARP [Trichosurus vulpecula]